MIEISKYGYNGNPDISDVSDGTVVARVTAVHKDLFKIVCDGGEDEETARLKSSVYFNGELTSQFPTAGDFVRIIHNPYGDSLITETLPRKSFFSRRNPTPGMGEQSVAANFDYVFILSSLNKDFNPKRLDRYVLSSWQSGAVPVIILTKADLCENAAQVVEQTKLSAPDVAVYAISSVTGDGIPALSGYFEAGKTLVFLGSSGVGKSTLVNALAGEEIMTTNGIREQDSKGHHTTTHRQLVMLKSGVMIIDTPGMRELGMWDVTDGIGKTFAEVEDFIGQCRFSDCTHTIEPGCAVKKAIAEGLLSQERLDSYMKLKKEAYISDSKTEMLAAKNQRNKAISKWNKQIKNERKRKAY